MKSVKVAVADSVEAVESLRPIWLSLAVPNIDADIDYFLTVVRQGRNVVSPYVLHIKVDGRDMLVVARLEEQELPIKFGYFVLGHMRLRALVLSFDGILGARGRADEALAFEQIKAVLRSGDASLLVARNFDISGDRLAAALATYSWLFRGHGQIPTRRWVIDVSDGFAAFLARRTSSTRKKLRREERELIKKFDGAVELRRINEPAQLDAACRDMAAVGALSYQHKLGAAFSGTGLDRALLQLGLDKGWSKVWLLYCGGRPVAFWPATIYSGVVAVGTPGFDPDYSEYAVGRFAMIQMINDLCQEPAAQVMDFGQGEAEYKSRFGQPLRHERDLMVAAPRVWPVVVIWIHSLFTLANEAARQVARSVGWVGHLKTAWRRRGTIVPKDAEVTS